MSNSITRYQKLMAIICPPAFALCLVALWAIPGPSDFEHLQHIEAAKQAQREHVQSLAATSAAARQFYNIEEVEHVPAQVFAKR